MGIKTGAVRFSKIGMVIFGLGLCMAFSACGTPASDTAAPVTVALVRTPDDGIQPQAAIDASGTVHMIYFKGEPMAGDLYYVRIDPGQEELSTPIRVNSQPESAIATGTIRGAQLVIGKNNRVHVAWNGSDKAEPKGPGGQPMLYTRLTDDGTAFEPQRNLITWAGGIDGGGGIAADSEGRVYVAWHASAGATEEAERAVFMARSTDEGSTFERERQISPPGAGACGCCGMRAHVDRDGALYVVYRTAEENVNRDIALLVSNTHGDRFEATTVHKWSIAACPMSSMSFAEGKTNVLMGWETESQVYYSYIQPGATTFSPPVAPSAGEESREHPLVLTNADGQTLFAWTEGTGWMKGGAVAWQVYDAKGEPTPEKGRADGVPVWGLLTGYVQPDGRFTLVY